MISKKEENVYKKAVLRAHNIEKDGKYFMCNDGDEFENVWEALDHTIYLDLFGIRDYFEALNKTESHQTMEEDTSVRAPLQAKDMKFPHSREQEKD